MKGAILTRMKNTIHRVCLLSLVCQEKREASVSHSFIDQFLHRWVCVAMLVLRIRTSHLICRSKWTSSTLLISLISFALYVLYGIPPADQVALLRGKYFVNEDLMRMCPKASSVVEPVLGKISYVRVIQHWRHHLSDESVINRALKCSANEEEEGEVFQSDVPLAFSIMAHKQLGLLELLLHQISHPRNSVCIHVDRKSSPKFHLGVEKLIECQRKKHRGLKIVKYSPSLK